MAAKIDQQTIATTIENKRENYIEQYSSILDKYTITYKEVGYHLQVGEITKTQGWILHISVVRWQVAELLNQILPILKLFNTPFKVVKNRQMVRQVLDGDLGYPLVGKVVTIYPEDDHSALSLVNKLIPLTMSLRGPQILTDMHLGGNVYTRYGGFSPVIGYDNEGREGKYIYDMEGQLIPDIYHIPFINPNGIPCPFTQIPAVPALHQSNILNQTYKITSVLKSDAKGNVYKAFYLRGNIFIKWCVIKQGKKNMWSDESGRDMPERIHWQKHLHEKFAHILLIPKILDLFIDNDDTYLVMEFIKGQSLYNKVREINKNCQVWGYMPIKKRLELLGYILQIIQIVRLIHQNNYVHRDITPVNFIIKKKNNTLVIIDNELSYSLNEQIPFPPFEFGTPGFMSPEQSTVCQPTFKEDIYGLGATIITLLTCLSPICFIYQPKELLNVNLLSLLGNKQLSKILSDALDPIPSNRPTLQQIESIIYSNQECLLRQNNEETCNIVENDHELQQLNETICSSIQGLVNSPTVMDDGLWCSAVGDVEYSLSEKRTEFTKSPGLAVGISGTLYILSRAKKLNFPIDGCLKTYNDAWNYVHNNYVKNPSTMVPGLYAGASGICLAIATGINAGLIENSRENNEFIQECACMSPIGPDLKSGAAGQGIAILQLAKLSDQHNLRGSLNQLVEYILQTQNRLGYWTEIQKLDGKRFPDISFLYGSTGITWFLLDYAQTDNPTEVKESIAQSLALILRQVPKIKKNIIKNGYWKTNADIHATDCIYGIITLLIKAYDVVRDPIYKKTAEDLLSLYPEFIVHDDFTQKNGLSGLGELYLDAYNAFNNIKWLLRAKWIARLFTHTCINQANGSSYWLGNNNPFATANLMLGNGGIIHFLMRYAALGKLGFRLLN